MIAPVQPRIVAIDPGSERSAVVVRFWSNVTKGPDCWVWTGYRAKFGYGQMKIGGRVGSVIYAHRLSWAIHNGEIPAGLSVCHRCDNPPCVNPAHLFLGDQAANNRDMFSKGRNTNWKRGEANARARLTLLQVRILRRLKSCGCLAMMARAWGVGETTARAAARGTTWSLV